MSRVVAVIPVKDRSERVPNKNFRSFAENKSLLEFKIDQLLASKAFNDIYISSNSDRAASLAQSKGLKHCWRDEHFCNNLTPWSEVICEVLNGLPEDPGSVVAWCHTTSPLFDRYAEAIQAFFQLDPERFDGLVGTKAVSAFLLNQKGRPLNYHWGVWHQYSQNLEKLSAVTGAIFIAEKQALLKSRYVISSQPAFFELSEYESCDLDNEYDFRLAQVLWEKRKELSKC